MFMFINFTIRFGFQKTFVAADLLSDASLVNLELLHVKVFFS